MRLIAFLLIASVILTLAKALTLVLILVFLASLLWALITRPLELLGFLLIALLTEAVSLRPLTTIFCIAGVATLVAIRGSAGSEPGQKRVCGDDKNDSA